MRLIQRDLFNLSVTCVSRCLVGLECKTPLKLSYFGFDKSTKSPGRGEGNCALQMLCIAKRKKHKTNESWPISAKTVEPQGEQALCISMGLEHTSN